jgi:2-polyprenyl-3-methyl-5-hydroxy-6-metoxy-1,4-benzoquinol methylase
MLPRSAESAEPSLQTQFPPDCQCRLCGGTVVKIGEGCAGYRAPDVYDVYDCTVCRSAFVSPMRADESIYDVIYERRADIPGYVMYEMFAKRVRKRRDPLKFLAAYLDIFWSVEQFVLTSPAKRILEVGCGLGYLTYALVKRGYDVVGIDVSTRAIEQARRSYGPYFREEALAEIVASGERFDAVIMTEVIEHVEDPASLLREAMSVLRPGGELFLTTPNRDYFAAGTLWQTEAPPVHLWWFSEDSMAIVAERLDAKVELTDFREYNRHHPDLLANRVDPDAPRGPILSSTNEVIRREGMSIQLPAPGAALLRLMRRMGLMYDVYHVLSCLVAMFGRGDATVSPRRMTMGARFTRRG